MGKASEDGFGNAAVDFIRVTVHYTAASGTPSATSMLIGSGR
jgi:hypothetical protein